MFWPFYSVSSHCLCNQMLQLSHWLHCPSQCPCSETLLLPVLLSNYMWSSQALSGSDRWFLVHPLDIITVCLSLNPQKWFHLLCPAKGICRSRWKGKAVSPCLLSEVNLLMHKAQSLERTEEMVSVKKKWLSGCCSFLTSAQLVLAALRSTRLAPNTDVCSGLT